MTTRAPKDARSLSQPRFGELMAVYEENYQLLQRVVGDVLQGHVAHAVSMPGDRRLALYVDVLERHRYTHLLRMSYLFDDRIVLRAEPNAFVRLYHDTGQAEASSFEPGRQLQSLGLNGQRLSQPAGDGLARSWRLNRFLERWLYLLLRQGHRSEHLRTSAMSIEERLASGRRAGDDAADPDSEKKVVSGA